MVIQSLLRTVKAINPRFSVVPCPEHLWTPERQFMVAREVLECGDLGGLYEFRYTPYPQLFLPSADYVDCNLIRALRTRTLEAARAQSKAINEARYSGTHAQARRVAEENSDELYYYANQRFKGYRAGWRKARNSMDDIRRLQDKLGRELR